MAPLDPIVTIACRLRLGDVRVNESYRPLPAMERGHNLAYRRVPAIARRGAVWPDALFADIVRAHPGAAVVVSQARVELDGGTA
jgi:hypothetical protein